MFVSWHLCCTVYTKANRNSSSDYINLPQLIEYCYFQFFKLLHHQKDCVNLRLGKYRLVPLMCSRCYLSYEFSPNVHFEVNYSVWQHPIVCKFPSQLNPEVSAAGSESPFSPSWTMMGIQCHTMGHTEHLMLSTITPRHSDNTCITNGEYIKHRTINIIYWQSVSTDDKVNLADVVWVDVFEGLMLILMSIRNWNNTEDDNYPGYKDTIITMSSRQIVCAAGHG